MLGSGRDDLPVPPEFVNLDWLVEHVQHRRKTTSNVVTVNEESDQEEEEEEQVKGAESDPEQSESQSMCGEPDSPLSAPSSCSSAVKEDSKPSAKTPKTPKQAPQGERPWSSSTKKASNVKSKENVDLILLKTASSLAEKINTSADSRKKAKEEGSDDEDSFYCKSLASRLRQLPSQKKAFARFQIEQVMYQAQLPAGGEFQSIPPNTSCQTPEFHRSPHMNLLNDPNYNNCLHY